MVVTLSSAAHDYGIDIAVLRKLNPGVCDNEPFNSINDIKMPADWYAKNGYNMTDQLERSDQSQGRQQQQPRTENQRTSSDSGGSWLGRAWDSVTGVVGEFVSDVVGAFRTEVDPYTGKKVGFFDRLGEQFGNVMSDWKKAEDAQYNR